MTNLSLELLDDLVLQDFKNFVQRAKCFDSGAIRLCALDQKLVTYVCVQHAKSILDSTPTVLAVRVMGLGLSVENFDVVVALDALSERFARMLEYDQFSAMRLNLVIPPTRVQVPWVGISPPRRGWVLLDSFLTSVEDLHNLQFGGYPNFPFVANLALQKLGFLEKGMTKVDLFACGGWLRLSTVYGHVMVRL